MAEDNQFFLTAQKLNRLERRKAEIEKEIDDCRTRLAAMDIGSEPRVAYDFGELSRVTVSAGRYRFSDNYSSNNFEDLPAPELQSLVDKGLVEKQETLEANTKFLESLPLEQTNELLENAILLKRIKYHENLKSFKDEDILNDMLEKNIVEKAPNRITVRKEPYKRYPRKK